MSVGVYVYVRACVCVCVYVCDILQLLSLEKYFRTPSWSISENNYSIHKFIQHITNDYIATAQTTAQHRTTHNLYRQQLSSEDLILETWGM